MGLCVQIAVLADLLENDAEGAEWFEQELARVNQALVAEGLPAHVEPRALPDLASRTFINGYPYSFLHYLRRVAAKQREESGYRAVAVPEGAEPDDPAVERELALMRSHLICHSDAEGWYIPYPFEQIVFSEDPEAAGGGIIGSSHTLLKELVAVAPALDIALQGDVLTDEEVKSLHAYIDEEKSLWIEKTVWLDLFEAARLSIQHGTAIVFG